MEEEYFTVTLTSSDTSYADNTLASFRTFLPKEVLLDGKWTVAITELHYTRSWFNVIEDENVILFDDRGMMTTTNNPIKAGWYDDDALLKALNKSIDECFKLNQPIQTRKGDSDKILAERPTIAFNENTRQVELKSGKYGKKEYFVHLSWRLADMLGLSRRKNYYTPERQRKDEPQVEIATQDKSIKGDWYGMNCYDLNYGIHSLFIYSNIVSPVIVGNAYAPLLRVVPIENRKFGAQCHQIFQKPYFYPVTSNCFQVIETQIRDKEGKLIPFKFGETTIVSGLQASTMKLFKQVGRGTYFVGRRYQRGNGFFGKMIKSAIFPFLKYIGSRGLKTAVAIGREVVNDPNADFKTVAKRKLLESGIEVLEDGAKRVKKYVQTGEGVKRRKTESIKAKKKEPKSKVKKKLKTKTKHPKTSTAKSVKKKKKPVKKRSKSRKNKPHPFLKKNGTPSV